MTSDALLGVQLQFGVVIDQHRDIGVFQAVDGLSAEYEVYEVKEGGYNRAVHRLPGRVKYTNVKLTRAVDVDSGRLAAWFTDLATTATTLCTAKITAYDGWQRELGHWSLTGVWPVKYTGPQLTATGTSTANEVLELAHGGFTWTQVAHGGAS